MRVNFLPDIRQRLAFFSEIFFGESYKSFRKDVKGFLFDVSLHGLFLNYVAFVLFSMPIHIYTFVAYGLAWWYIKEEAMLLLRNLILFWRRGV